MSFVDSSFWVALLVPRDDHHEQAAGIWHRDPGA